MRYVIKYYRVSDENPAYWELFEIVSGLDFVKRMLIKNESCEEGFRLISIIPIW